MKSSRGPINDKSAIDLLEESVRMLRRTGPGTLCLYYIGVLPFVLGLLFFWTDMSRGASAPAHLLPASLGLSLLYLWMKCWQAAFAAHLRAELAELPPPTLSPIRVLRLVLVQACTAPWSCIVLPAALLITLPFGWCFAFFQNLTALGQGGDPVGPTLRRAWRQAALWPAQNHMLLGFFFLFVPSLFLNLGLAAAFLPRLAQILFGIESVFTRGHFSYANTTFLAAVAVLTYLCVDPLIKAAYVLRCYYGDALQSGEDLRTALKRLAAGALLAAAIFLPATLLPMPAAADPVPAAAAPAGEAIAPEHLDRSLDEVLAQLEYSWRLPRTEQPQEEEDGFLAGMVATVKGWLESIIDWIGDAMRWLSEKLQGLFPRKPAGPAQVGQIDWSMVCLYLILAGALAAAGVWLRRNYRRRSQPAAASPAPAARAVPNLAEEAAADQLPTEEWQELGRELLRKGELRLALRAMFLGILADLSARGLLTLGRSKSNREYLRELQRRAHGVPSQVEAFTRILPIVESAWYGLHPVGPDTVERFLTEQKRIFDHGRP